ncbi:helix-turn-helix domain-containing protein [Streptomyces sp. LZ34]
MDGRIPQPHDVEDSAQFVAVMRQLRQWADLSYRELERRAGAAGDVLPRATLAGALNRQELPREELVAAFVRACGGDKDVVEAWVGVRKRLAVELEEDSPGAVEPDREDGPESAVAEVAEEADEAGGSAQPVARAEACDTTVPSPTVETVSVVEPEPEPEPEPVTVAEPVAVVEPVTVVEPVAVVEVAVRESSPLAPPSADPAPKGLKSAGRRLRRPGVVITATAAIVLLTAAATAILHPGDKPGEPRESSRTEAPAAATSSGAPSRPSDGATSSGADAEPVKDDPTVTEPRETSSPAPSQKTTASKKPKPTRSSPTSEWTPYDPPSLPDDPPPSTDTPPPSDGADPYPTETCWDVTNDCT